MHSRRGNAPRCPTSPCRHDAVRADGAHYVPQLAICRQRLYAALCRSNRCGMLPGALCLLGLMPGSHNVASLLSMPSAAPLCMQATPGMPSLGIRWSKPPPATPPRGSAAPRWPASSSSRSCSSAPSCCWASCWRSFMRLTTSPATRPRSAAQSRGEKDSWLRFAVVALPLPAPPQPTCLPLPRLSCHAGRPQTD